jgi:ribose 1,5-bisphosphokinase PhnN
MRSQLIELVGPAGAGKSTLLQSLLAESPEHHAALTLWGLPRTLLLRCAASLMSTMRATAQEGRPLRAAEFTQMMRLRALRLTVDRVIRCGRRRILIDEGGVFGLTWLEVFFVADGSPVRREWRQNELAGWARRLAAVVRIDAPDRVLAERIRSRAKDHMVKGESDESIAFFTRRFRLAYDRVLNELSALSGIPVLTFTSEGRVPDDARRLRSALEEVLRAS